jgi:hypothetical protein
MNERGWFFSIDCPPFLPRFVQHALPLKARFIKELPVGFFQRIRDCVFT